jgi:hypothetical protein
VWDVRIDSYSVMVREKNNCRIKNCSMGIWVILIWLIFVSSRFEPICLERVVKSRPSWSNTFLFYMKNHIKWSRTNKLW